jgi:hypothetical protein
VAFKVWLDALQRVGHATCLAALQRMLSLGPQLQAAAVGQ